MGIGVSAIALLGLLGSWWWVLDLVGSFRAQQVVVLLALGLMAVRANVRSAAIALLVATLLAAPIAGDYLGRPRPIADGAGRIEIMSFNVGVSNPNRSEVVDYIATEDPEVVHSSGRTQCAPPTSICRWSARCRHDGLRG
jgi:endonuclease/exonuclease/phosphatase (EEP) superfamily protein YafD